MHIPRGFTKAFINGQVVEDLPARIRSAWERVAVDREVLLVEGTGHAGVGSVIDLSNAAVAKMLGARAVIVSEAGVGRPIDEIVLNHALFTRHGVEVAGAVVNKVDHDAHPSLAKVLERGLAQHGIELLGVLPYTPLLSNPTLSMLQEQMKGELLHPGPDLGLVIEHVAIGAMQAEHVLERVGPGSLLIVPGDREDVIATMVSATLVGRPGEATISTRRRRQTLAGVVLTGGYRPSKPVIDAIRQADIFTYLVTEDTYAAASEVHDLLVKTHPDDTEKIELITAARGRAPRCRSRPGDASRSRSAADSRRQAFSRASLSMSRALPKRTAAESNAGPSTRSSSRSVSPSAQETYSTSASGSAARTSRITWRSASAGALAGRPAVARGQQRAVDDRRRSAFLGREVDVARRERQAVRLPYGRAGDDLGRQRQVAGHLPDDHDLLRVLLAEVGVLGADQREEDGDDGRHAIEVPRSRGTLQGTRPPPRR